jgi:[ribosomal protein S5]-alanine N-acetyltransferase
MNSILETQRLVLKPILKSDRDTLHAILTDSYVRRYMCDNQIWSLQKVEDMVSESQKYFETEKFGLWFVETKSDREIIGFVGLWYFFGESQPQLAYALLPQATKKGYATEATTRIIEYSFNELGYDYLLASCDRPNLESRQLATRLGMKQIKERTINENPTIFFKIEKT